MSFEESDELYVSELRQWTYCPRVVWYGRMFADRRPTSGLMKVGIEEESERERLEERRTFAAYGLEAVARRYQVPVESDQLGLRGRIDMLIETSRLTWECQGPFEPLAFVPVEVKTTVSPFRAAPAIQLCTYAMMIEEMKGVEVPFGFIATRPEERIQQVFFTLDLRRSVHDLLDSVRQGIRAPELPGSTPQRGKCLNCEFRRFCNDVW